MFSTDDALKTKHYFELNFALDRILSHCKYARGHLKKGPVSFMESVPGLPVVLDASYDDCLVWGLVPANRVINILVSRRRGRAYKGG
jgi:hypothetical protein